MSEVIEMEERINTENICPICSREIEEENECITNCTHKYCKLCLEDWLRRGNISCPLCRGDIINYTNNEIINQIICIQRNNTNNGNNVITIGGNRRNIQNEVRLIINQNLRLKYALYMCFIFLLCIGNFYRELYDHNKYIERKYLKCERNNTILTNELMNVYKSGRIETVMDATMIRGGSIYHCNLPRTVYEKCFII